MALVESPWNSLPLFSSAEKSFCCSYDCHSSLGGAVQQGVGGVGICLIVGEELLLTPSQWPLPIRTHSEWLSAPWSFRLF